MAFLWTPLGSWRGPSGPQAGNRVDLVAWGGLPDSGSSGSSGHEADEAWTLSGLTDHLVSRIKATVQPAPYEESLRCTWAGSRADRSGTAPCHPR
jgi:hypothetical protein